MLNHPLHRTILLLLLTLWLAACAAQTPAPTEAPIVAPVATDVPPATPENTPTAAAVAESTPTPATESASATSEACHVQAKAFIAETDALVEDWNAVLNQASQLLPREMEPALVEMEAVRDRAEVLDAPECAAYVRDYLVKATDAFIEGFTAVQNGNERRVINYKLREGDLYFLEFERGMVALRNGLELSAVPTPTIAPIVAGADESPVTLPTTMTITPSGDATGVAIYDSPGGNILNCRLDGGIEVQVTEASRDREYLRIEGTDCDGWVNPNRVTP